MAEQFVSKPIGAVFTPPFAARFAVETFGLLDLWLGGKTVLDPTMGEGNLLGALVDSALERGCALSSLPFGNLFGVERDSGYCKNALAKFSAKYNADMAANFFNADILAFSSQGDGSPQTSIAGLSLSEVPLQHPDPPSAWALPLQRRALPRCDALFGNPPWCNFADLPDGYKQQVKPLFSEYGLVGNRKKLLLGGSRIDIAALVIQKAIADNLADGGAAAFFLPLSLLLNDGAHEVFRHFTVKNSTYSLKSVYDFADLDVFGVSTRSGLAFFEKSAALCGSMPASDGFVPYFRYENEAAPNKTRLISLREGWREYQARPAFGKKGAPFIVSGKTADIQIANSAAAALLPNGETAANKAASARPAAHAIGGSAFPRILVPPESKPRQGVNTCGANDVFIFAEYEAADDLLCRVFSKAADAYCLLPRQFVYPLITAGDFAAKNARGERFGNPQQDRAREPPLEPPLLQAQEQPRKWVLLPYAADGKPLPDLSPYPPLLAYLQARRNVLSTRKGTLIGSQIRRGLWWALLGVGLYSFATYKIVWEAYGRKRFAPRIFEGLWQANQSLQAFIPCSDENLAQRLLAELKDPAVEQYLLASKMEGTMTWAQPGKVSALLEFTSRRP